jgi:UDP-glucuronate decarboxylase
VSNFIVQALRNEPITIYGDGSQTRSFCYVTDLIEGLASLMTSRDDFSGPVNLGNPHEFTILELAEKVRAMVGSKAKVVFRELPQDDPTQRQPDISLAHKELGWTPKVALDAGLAPTIKYFDRLLSNRTATA